MGVGYEEQCSKNGFPIVCYERMHAYSKSSGPIFLFDFNKSFSPHQFPPCYWLKHTITEADVRCVLQHLVLNVRTIRTNSIFTTFSIINSLLHTHIEITKLRINHAA